MKPWDDEWIDDVKDCTALVGIGCCEIAFGYMWKHSQYMFIQLGEDAPNTKESDYDFDNYPPFYVQVDGTPALLSRDEEACRRFSALWELAK